MAFASSSSPKAILCYLLCIFVIGVASFENTICPFDYLFHFGDGVFDDGNAIRTLPDGPSLPAAFLPYGETDPGYPTGRFCDGLLDIDFGARAMGFPEITPYLGGKTSQINAIMFAVAKSPVLCRDFFTSKGIKFPSYVAPLEVQMSWFKEYLNTVCSTSAECANNILGNSFFLFGDVEANDITYPLLQGKSIEEVKTYAPLVTQAQINVAREAISMGATRIVFPGNVPIGCYPFMLTEYVSINGSAAFDDTGCLKDINDLIEFKNNDLNNSVNNLMKEFPDVTMFYADFYDAFVTMRREWHYLAGRNQDLTLKACCGIGGEYNYDENRFCGSEGVPVCDDPLQYLHWDGIHLTHEANDRLSYILQQGALELLNCTTAELFKTPRRPLKISQLFKTPRRPQKISQLFSSI